MTPAINKPLQALLRDLGIPADYGVRPRLATYDEATELVEAGENIVGRMQTLTPATATAWNAMQAAAQSDSVTLLMVSGFRSFEYQAGLLRAKLDKGLSIAEILNVNVAPGFSQHHTGNAIDIATPGSKPLLEEFAETAAFTWLQEHAVTYGFSMSYPRDNSEGIAYEPWHWYRKET